MAYVNVNLHVSSLVVKSRDLTGGFFIWLHILDAYTCGTFLLLEVVASYYL